MSKSEILERYEKKNVLITGATGFVGLALLEKLLRCIPDIGMIYILMRPKKGKDVKTRLKNLLNDRIFDRLQKEMGISQFQKVIPIQGDISENGLGLSMSDRYLLIKNVHIVFHSAASLDIAASLKKAVAINLYGTRQIVEFCEEAQIEALVHVSTAYANSHMKHVSEKIYEAPNDPDKVIEIASTLLKEEFQDPTCSVLKYHPNVYTFTKALAEHEIRKELPFPRVIIRPSMILGSWKEPIPGWTNSKNGPQGFLLAAAKGVIRRLPVRKDLVYDYIPVDVVVNAMIASVNFVTKEKENGTDISAPTVLQCTTSIYNPFKWSLVENKINEMLHLYPLKDAIWYPSLKLVPYMFLFQISALIFHMIPAFFFDTILKVTGKRPVLVRLHTNVNKSLSRLKPFIINEWKFSNRNCMHVHQSLNDVDKELFGFDVKKLDWEDYFSGLFLGARLYLNNEDQKTLPAARKKDSLLWFLYTFVKFSVILFFWYGSSMLGCWQERAFAFLCFVLLYIIL